MTGIICIDKEQGRTSFSVCAEIRRITGQKKCGHMGTLDPLATGVLPVMLGGATRFLDYYPGSDKGYRARFLLGKTTDTLDITGIITGEYPVDCSADDVAKALESFKGDITQIPPMYSAVSVGGKRLYELARQGESIERPSRRVTVRSIELISADENTNEYEIDVLCSKGTYIRTLIDDLGKVLGCGAVMTALERTYAYGFTLKDCVKVSQLSDAANSEKGISQYLIPVDKALSDYEQITVSPAQSVRFKNGGSLDLARIRKKISQGALVRVYSPSAEFLGLGEVGESELSVKRVYVE